MNTVSILTIGRMGQLLLVAHQNREKDGFLVPVLLINVGAKAPLILELRDLPETPEQKQAYFAQIGTQFRRRGQHIREAIMLTEAWMVWAQEAPAALRFRPSQHPSRQEGLVLIGRNAANTHSAQLVEPFTRDAANQPVWGAPMLTFYDESVEKGHHTQGVLDDLFQANQQNMA